MNKKNILFALTALCGIFLAVQSGASLLPFIPGESTKIASEALRLFVVAGLIGTMLPVVLGRKAELPYDRNVTRGRIIMGISLFAGAVILEMASFSSWFTILTANPDDTIRIKHILVTLPFATGLTLLFYFLLPETLERALGTDSVGRAAALIVPAGALGLTIYAETGFSRVDVLVVMTAVGLLAAAGHMLTDKFFLTFVAVFLAVYANSLADLRYAGFSWPVAVAGFFFYLALLVAGFYIRLGDTGDELHA